MKEYPKINSIYKRDDRGRFTTEYSCPEFGFLANNDWLYTEKIDGTNIRIGFEGKRLIIGGRTDRAQIPAFLYDFLSEKFSSFANEETVLYGEGYGKKIQQGERYIPDGVGFILFDVCVGKWWLQRPDIEDVGKQFGVPVVPIVGSGSLSGAVRRCQIGFDSAIAKCEAEGIVLRPKVELFARNGERIITKVKLCDFREGRR